MRIRNVPGAFEKIMAHSHVVSKPMEHKGRWKEVFGNGNPIHLELGMGKGRFILGHAQAHPDVNYIGFEKFSSVLYRATEKIDHPGHHPNVRLLLEDVANLTDIFEENEVERIYLNFSDPWPKDRHVRRRLTHRDFLEKYSRVLGPCCDLVFKTDNQKLFDFSVEEMKAYGLEIVEYTRDLHNIPYAEGNIMTEYEKKFSGKGHPIYRVAVRFRPQP
ncbi:tRNA (guanosine(46)-N7)-methyltransferase TrmB [Anaerotalea alkaliphila]|uniref:tRNA (guanine-N(7)-)-methyltransferase n=1 Tax=Anaerotalea alkaliphila TaxID=2662126 RepID=A0A7X5HW31_9FIRM|nr:tRNA (guanosine(46)-N7)-methyltransferase TrmB [Anaerotalea alkaliphila]NDL67716.1 tRNA (guanosine(46)-N7)-methyltransferase TrmB [Anaerotalea alkaliphila]